MQVEYWMAVDATYDAVVELSPAPPAPVPDPTDIATWSGAVTGDAVVELAVTVDRPATCDLVGVGYTDGVRHGMFVGFIRIGPDVTPQVSTGNFIGGYVAVSGLHTDPTTAATRSGFGAQFSPTASWSPGVHRLLLVGRVMKPAHTGWSMSVSADCDVPFTDVKWAGSRELLLVDPATAEAREPRRQVIATYWWYRAGERLRQGVLVLLPT